jgi:hypothetical protein
MAMNDLETRFVELRNEEELIVPRFVAPPPRPRTRTLPALRWALAMLLIVAIVALFPRHRVSFSDADRAAAQSITEWQAPTDFLLRTPGREILTTMPSIPSKGVAR